MREGIDKRLYDSIETAIDQANGLVLIKSFEKDNFPPTLFEFGNIRFVTSKNHLYCYPAAMKFCDGILMEMEE